MNDFFKLVRKDEYEKEEQYQKSLLESKAEFDDYVKNKVKNSAYPLQKLNYSLNVAKKVMCEVFSELYMNSIPIDDYIQYRDTLYETASSMMMDEMSDVKNMKQLKARFENASPYIKNMVTIAESIAEKKAEEICKKDEEFPRDVMLDSDDIKIIDNFEKIQGKDIYANDIKDRVVDVYEAEAKLAQDQQEKTQKIVDELSKKNNDTITESVLNNGIRLAEGNRPKTLFNAIFMNKSKHILNESGAGADLDSYKEDVLVETLCTYTLLECIHALGIRTIDSNEREKLKTRFLVS